MRAGLLRHRISCYMQNMAEDGCGGFIEQFSLRGSCWAKVSGAPMPSNEEQYRDRRIETVKGYKIRTRNNIGFEFLNTDVIIFKNRLFRIQGITNIDEHDFKYELFCYEIERDSINFGASGGLFDQEGVEIFGQNGLEVYDQQGV